MCQCTIKINLNHAFRKQHAYATLAFVTHWRCPWIVRSLIYCHLYPLLFLFYSWEFSNYQLYELLYWKIYGSIQNKLVNFRNWGFHLCSDTAGKFQVKWHWLSKDKTRGLLCSQNIFYLFQKLASGFIFLFLALNCRLQIVLNLHPFI